MRINLDPTLLLMLPGLILSLWAQYKVKSAYQKYGAVPTGRGIPAQQAVKALLTGQNAGHVQIEQVPGQLTDHFDPKTDTLRLSEGVYGSSSVAAVAIAAHEAGHALQKEENYPFLSLRSLMVPVVNFGSKLSWPVFLMGLIFSWEPLMTAGIVLFLLVVAFSLVTLPVEFNASNRALTHLTASGWYTEDELSGMKKVLTAAALTYVASFVSAFLQLLRLVAIANRNRRRR